MYSGIRMTPAPWNAPLLEIKAVAEARAGQAFNSVLLNLYRDGRDSVSWHADNERARPRPGHRQRLARRHPALPDEAPRRRKRLALDLPPARAWSWPGPQHHWLHQVPKTSRPVGARINLTFRAMAATA